VTSAAIGKRLAAIEARLPLPAASDPVPPGLEWLGWTTCGELGELEVAEERARGWWP
jgi:hypothetical protein